MSRAAEEFVEGRGHLAALLAAVPQFEPPADMAAWFSQLATAAQTQRASLQFEPPASLTAGFLAEAARIQAAQQPRHDAVVAAMKAGRPAREVLGHDVSEITSMWVEAQPQRQPAARKPQPRRWPVWAPRFALAGVAIVAVGIGVRNWQAPELLPQAEPAPAVAMDAPGFKEKAASPELADSSLAGASGVVQQAREPTAPAAAPPVIVLESRGVVAAAAPDKKTRSVSGNQPVPTDEDMAAVMNAYESAKLSRRAAAEQGTQREEESKAKDTAGAVADAERRLAKAPAPAVAAVPAPMAAAAPPRPAVPAAEAPAPEPEREALMARKGGSAFDSSLASSPQLAARRWALMGQTRPPQIRAADVRTPALKIWVEAFRQALPPAMRPARLVVLPDSALSDDQLRIERPPR